MPAALAQTSAPSRHHTLTLGMAQLAMRGLAEDWWLKYLGDVHWQLIAEAVGQQTTVFRDAKGRQLYAAFCASEFSQIQPDLIGLGHSLEIISTLWAAGRSRIQSDHCILARGQEIARIRLVSTFVAHMEAGVNASVSRATPFLVPVLDQAPDSFAHDTSQLAKAHRNSALSETRGLDLPTHVGMDYNTVGLLYFPSFSRLFEQAEAALHKPAPWAPIARRLVLYFGNVEPGESVTADALPVRPGCLGLWKQATASQRATKLAQCWVSRHCPPD
ncbi:hypothetical protein J7382_10270 [Shimia sp. R11_0]|uniref:Pnap_2097 family protein n=1 Tax=Shimia sp. R11_0 TaxID=2821096 RepID=UPI001ADBC6E1|nr:Pnap_2097 family protein [Shimia sp. R11_0]MBO9477919.1 hypothetical protein [Shimia sp. R11_0]